MNSVLERSVIELHRIDDTCQASHVAVVRALEFMGEVSYWALEDGLEVTLLAHGLIELAWVMNGSEFVATFWTGGETFMEYDLSLPENRL